MVLMPGLCSWGVAQELWRPLVPLDENQDPLGLGTFL